MTEDATPTHAPAADARELVILAAPGNDGYYDAVEDAVFEFHIRYADALSEHDEVIILTHARLRDKYVTALGDKRVALAPMGDIWMRDFAPLNAAAPILMRYSAAGQGGGRSGKREAAYVQNGFTKLMAAAGLELTRSNYINDGGNFVDDYAGRAVVSRKFLADNDLTETEGRAALKAETGAAHIAFINADEQGGLEHADGVVAFIAPNVLVINTYAEDPEYKEALIADLKAGLPTVTLHEIVTPYDGTDIYDERFGSACGLYTNMLVTPERIYLPQFGIPSDAEALASVRRWTDRQVIPVDSQGVCRMGGGVRCMSWQLRGEKAETLKAFLDDS